MHRFVILVLASVLLAPTLAVGAESRPAGPPLTVMTRNLYVGFDVDLVIGAVLTGNVGRILMAVKGGLDAVRASDFPGRAERLADEIERRRPALIGLQEVSLIRVQEPADFSPVPNATAVEIDFLAVLLSALAARGLAYDVAGSIDNVDSELPALRDDFTCCREIRLTDRDVMLVRRGEVQVLGVHAANFATNLSIPLGGTSLTLRRGWVAVDATVHGRSVRVVNTHLEAAHPGVQFAQGLELLAGPANTALPLVLLGDFNSAADGTGTATYAALTAAGLADTWDAISSAPGATCCHAADLLNPMPTLVERIDIVFTRGDFVVLDAEVVGEELADRTPSGLWPSDHAGVVTTLRAPKP